MATSNEYPLTGELRTEFGKGASRRLRATGRVPAVMYGSGSEVRHITLPAHETGLTLRVPRVVLRVSVGEDSWLVAPRDIQRHPIKDDLRHLDLVLLSDSEVADRYAFTEALEAAAAAAEEAGLDPTQAQHVIEEAAAEGADLKEAVANIVETLQEQQRAYAAASAASEAAEAAAEAAGEGAEEVTDAADSDE